MPDIVQDLPIRAPIADVFAGVSTPEGLNEWWCLTSSGLPEVGSEYALGFGPDYQWKARVLQANAPTEFELEFTEAEPDWLGTRVGFRLEEKGGATHLRFHHRGWADESDHFRTTSHCWAMYLRILRRHLEHGESVPYPDRLDV